jgi:two-component SAPR family response regulator
MEKVPPCPLPLAARRVLVVEDNYFIADDVCNTLKTAGAEVVGPASTTAEAIRLLDDGSVNAAVLDVNLEGEMSYPVAAELERLAIPFIFASGYDDWAVPKEWQHIPRLEKPYSLRALPQAVAGLFVADETRP